MFFTRLPLWRLYQPQRQAFSRAASFWPFAGWLTAGIMILVFNMGLLGLSLPIVALLTIGARILLTGALHEDGLADFADGMGGGHNRDAVLRIMKDSHIGTFGVVAIVLYLGLFYFSLRELTLGFFTHSLSGPCKNPLLMVSAAMLTADVWAKCCGSLLTGLLPYARNEEEAKARVVYTPLQWGWHLLRMALAMAPAVLLWCYIGVPPHPLVFIVPLVTLFLLVWWLKLRLGGYTGDCCGASFLICESTIYLTWMIVL